MAEQFTYAVARIRALEVSLFNNATIDGIITSPSYESAIQYLQEKGWGDASTTKADEILKKEEEKIWEVVKDLHVDMKYFQVLSLPKDFHNLKAAIKESTNTEKGLDIYYEDANLKKDFLLEILAAKDYFKLPENMQHPAEDAYEALLHTGDGQLCDLIIDRACLDAIYEAGQKSDASIIKEYAESTVAVADIKIAVRSAKTNKTLEFMNRAMAKCDSLNVDQLAKAALQGSDSLKDYLMGTAYKEGAEALGTSPSEFERWCDNKIIETISPQKYRAFTIGPVIAYVIARQNEIKTVRIILTGKANNLSEDSIRERVREMYV
ncbi:MAG: V-type ATPase subunit [Lachnospiraceae bacterium]|jgi:V/A-type H+-transporting ATPase subunit C|nr:V-type ATPase subunit [Lachnospiraceae bacterium]